MKYYFNTLEQIQGDEAYNEKNFEQALVHYKKALSLLNQIASQRNFKPNKPFYDALAYVLSEITITKADHIMASLDDPFSYNHIQNLWEDIPSLLHEMNIIYEKIRFFELRETKKEKINITYKAVANCCESISDALIDSLNENEAPIFEQVTSALTWLTQAINYRKNAKLPIAMDLHVGYLNLLERAYKCNHEKQFLTQITAYIQENRLIHQELWPMQELEILSYQLLVATENKDEDSAAKYVKRCKKLMEDSDHIDHESLIIEDINTLISKLTNSTQTKNLKNRSRKPLQIIIEESDEELEATSMDVSTIPKRIDEIGEDMDMSLSEDSLLSDMNIDEIQTSTISQQLHTVAPHFNPLVPTSSPSSNFSMSNKATFFAPPSTPNTLTILPQRNPTDAFVKVMQEISNHYRDPKFLANLLSLIGDFYYKSRSLPFKNIPLISFEIYETVLLLDRQHSIAHARLCEIYNRSHSNKRMIDEHRHYTGATKYSSSTQGSFISIFNTAIEENMIQIETFLSINNEKQENVVNDLVLFVANNMVEKNIAGGKSQLIADFIRHSQEPMDIRLSMNN
ncbi:hypothetical protein [Legionella santicrucis]|nr:hypothetical protein [Legionella santicrucis]